MVTSANSDYWKVTLQSRGSIYRTSAMANAGPEKSGCGCYAPEVHPKCAKCSLWTQSVNLDYIGLELRFPRVLFFSGVQLQPPGWPGEVDQARGHWQDMEKLRVKYGTWETEAWDFLMLVIYGEWCCEILEKEMFCHRLNSPRKVSGIWQFESTKTLGKLLVL